MAAPKSHFFFNLIESRNPTDFWFIRNVTCCLTGIRDVNNEFMKFSHIFK